MEHLPIAKRNITPEKAKQILEKHGTIITLEEGKIMLDVMYKLGKLCVQQLLKSHKSHENR
jgi:hypothetical protein